MITCNLQGGLGNQMFQIATTIAHAKKIGTDYFFDFEKCHTPNQGRTSNFYKNTIFKNLNIDTLENYTNLNVYNEPNFSFNEIPTNDNVILNGYFQSENYFKNYETYIANKFYFDEFDNITFKLLDKIRNGKPLTSVHVRRGDYLKFSDVHPICPIEYYIKSMEIIGESVFVIISDDINWCKENIIGDNIYFSDYNNELLDMSIIKNCDYNINANSSFSWWGAWLNNNKNKKVICPKNWFSDKSNINYNDLIPKEWIQI
jgi:hypothetical protein